MSHFRANASPSVARRASIAVFAAVALCALSATFLHIPPDRRLAGTEAGVRAPRLTPRTWLDGSFAAGVEPWLARHFGFRGYAIRVANQINYSFFGSLPKNKGTGIDVGRDHWLFEHEYVRFHVGRYRMKQRHADRFARQAAKLRGLLAKRGIPLVVLVSPAKPEIYPEYLPDGVWPDAKTLASVTAREQMSSALRKAGVPVVDAHDLLLQMKDEPGAPLLFPAFGTHWNLYAAQRTLQEVWGAARKDAPSLPPFPSATGFEMAPPSPTDRDLEGLLNLLWYHRADDVPRPVFGDEAPSGDRAAMPGVLLVGDSFCFQLMELLHRSRCAGFGRLLFYFRARYEYPYAAMADAGEDAFDRAEDFRKGSLDYGGLDWDGLLDGVGLVVIEFNEIYARRCAWGFLDFALRGLGGGAGEGPESSR